MRHFQILKETDQRWYEQLAKDIWSYFNKITPEQQTFLKKNSWQNKDSMEAYLWRLYGNIIKTNTWSSPEEIAYNMALNDYRLDQEIYREIRTFLDSNQQSFDFGQ